MKFSFTSKTKEFLLVYHVSADCTSTQTIVYLNEDLHYSTGFNVTISPDGAAKWSKTSKNYITVEHNEQTKITGTSISVFIKKA